MKRTKSSKAESSMRRHNASQLEASMSSAQALLWAAEWHVVHGRWPDRRWRVEGGRGGPSRMLTLKTAQRAVAQYGGRIVELVPSRRAYLKACKASCEGGVQ